MLRCTIVWTISVNLPSKCFPCGYFFLYNMAEEGEKKARGSFRKFMYRSAHFPSFSSLDPDLLSSSLVTGAWTWTSSWT